MNWEAIGSVGEVIGAIAVLTSLVYLAVQIRQNTRSLNTSSYAQAAEQAWLVNLAIAQDADLARIIADDSAGKALSPEDTVRLDAALSNYFVAGENVYRLYERGLLDSDTWKNIVVNIYGRFTPEIYDRWRERDGPLSKRLLAYLESQGIPPIS